MSRYAQRYIALRVAYFGTRYNGFAYQADDGQTVEGALLSALTRTRLVVDRESCRWSCGGRTDKGVSALGQVVALQVRSNMPRGDAAATPEARAGHGGEGGEGGKPWSEIDYVGVINRCLPDDVRVLGWAPVADDFSARFSADCRTYKYFFTVRLPFPFEFFGRRFEGDSQLIMVSSNGYFTFGSTHYKYGNTQTIPHDGVPDEMAAVYWSDFDPSAGRTQGKRTRG